ncbi:hypothetical protein [Bradyrhizobium sp. AUGA SZCCT0182]|uniref:hypothetical protein n=1 Tax=Bradyrhizobium sp. AUGA SZCCT0182 TaxID=2807667 RepID=UPI001BADCE2B|nr:hypothetical protein [Bradyrhizobium sp. AUGA SZCCT0182]MBR1233340.1 hypothetical protein [Bradyrhizobium sp. AUGA SZCCT0182]
MQFAIGIHHPGDYAIRDHIAEIGRVICPVIALKRPDLRRARSELIAVAVNFHVILEADAVRQIFGLRVTAPAFDGEPQASGNVIRVCPDKMRIVGVRKHFEIDFRHSNPRIEAD